MRLVSVALKNVGCFSDAACLGPLDSGLSVLSAANEAGKSTLLMATARAFFDRHNVTGESITALQPVGTSLAPEVTVTFETSEGRFRIRKRFLQSPSAELSAFRDDTWQVIADGDAADGRLLELVAGTRPGRGASKPEHWGMLRHLWARQGERSRWPDFGNETGERVRNRLAGVEVDQLVEYLVAAFVRIADAQFTATGRLKKNGPLAALRDAITSREAELGELRATRRRVDEQQQQFVTSREALDVCEQSKADADATVTELTDLRRNVELLRKDLERFDEAYVAAEQALAAIEKDGRELETDRQALEEAKTRQKAQSETALALQGKDAALRAELEERRKQRKQQQAAIEALRKREIRLRDIGALSQADAEVVRLAKARDQATVLDAKLAALREKRAGLPELDRKTLRKMQAAEQQVRELGIRIEAVGLRIRITPDGDAGAGVSRDGQPAVATSLAGGATAEVVATRSVELTIKEWGSIAIDSGAQEAAVLDAEITKQRAALEALLQQYKVDSVTQALELAEQATAVDRELATVRDALTVLLEDWGTLDALRQALDTGKGSAARFRTRLALAEDELALVPAELEARLSSLQDELRALEGSAQAADAAVDAGEATLAAVGEERTSCAVAADEVGRQVAALSARIKTRLDRYPSGIEDAVGQAQRVFVQAKAERTVAAGNLPADWEKIEQRHERALKAASQVADEYAALSRTISGLQAVLREWGSQGLYSRETELIEALAVDRQLAEVLQAKATAARLLAALLGYRKKESVRTVLAPLEDQLSLAFAELTGDHARRVYLDEDLRIAGIGRDRDQVIAFTQLSQGAREQLLLALRAAVACELAKDEPQILILDDVLVNTDPVRQQRVLDYLQTIAGTVQVLVVTCHPDMYRGVGTAVGVSDCGEEVISDQ